MKEYYEKKRSTLDAALNELIVSKLAEKINIICPKIKIAKDENNEFIILSENLENLGNFREANYYLLPPYQDNIFYLSMYEIKESLERSFTSLDVTKLMSEVIKIYLLDYLISNGDRHADNWGILRDGMQMNIAIIDNESAFNPNAYFIMTSNLNPTEYLLQMKNASFGTLNVKTKKELKTFMETFCTEYAEIIKNTLDVLTPTFFSFILDDIEANEFVLNGTLKEKIVIPHKDSLLELYTCRYNNMLELWLDKEKKSSKTV